jgi:leucyl aminopeptidase
MDINFQNGHPLQIAGDCLVVALFEGEEFTSGVLESANQALDGSLKQLSDEGELVGKSGTSTLIHTLGKVTPRRILFTGLGKRNSVTEKVIKDVFSAAIRKAREIGLTKIVVDIDTFCLEDITPQRVCELITLATINGLYRYEDHISEKSEKTVKEVILNTETPAESSVISYAAIADAINLARDLANAPANFMTPGILADIAEREAKANGIAFERLDEDKMRELGMGSLLGVSQGSNEPAYLIVLKYVGNKDNTDDSIALVGKGITFDSGGLSLKSPAGMITMKGDMAGGAAVIGALIAISKLALNINVYGIIAATENMPGGRAQRPGDVVTAMNGTTIEVINTDAEGRLVLADALCYANHLGVNKIVDVATLTGAIRTALGDQIIGAFGNNDEFTKEVIEAGVKEGERLWELPADASFSKHFKSDVADIKNVGGAAAGASIGAMIIGTFAEDTPWVHLDIAGVSRTNSINGDDPKGATGTPVKTLVSLCKFISEKYSRNPLRL